MKIKADAVIVAAGCGKRSGLSVPKQFFEISGRPVLAYTVDVFKKHPLIEQIIVVLPSDDFEENKTYMSGFVSDCTYIKGGETRMQSVYNGLCALKQSHHSDIVAVHDGVRPYVTEKIITDSIDCAAEFGAALTAVNITDTVKSVKDGVVEATLNRDLLFSAQTPQTFRFDILMSAYENAVNSGIIYTDESAVVEASGVRVHISEGAKSNIKLTVAEDFERLK